MLPFCVYGCLRALKRLNERLFLINIKATTAGGGALPLPGRYTGNRAPPTMSETPRQNAQASRHARRQSPYTRIPAQESAAPSTPVRRRPAVVIVTLTDLKLPLTQSRLRSLLSYVSPFRSGRKGKVEAAPTNESEERQVEQAATTSSADTESADNGYSATLDSASSARATDEFDAPYAGPSTSTRFGKDAFLALRRHNPP